MHKSIIIAGIIAAATSSIAIAQKEGMTRDKFLKQTEKRFGKMDADSNGKLTKDEYLKAAQERAVKNGEAADSVKPKRVQKMLAAADGDGNGEVTLEEFKATEGAKFDSKDGNKNGVIDADEAGGAPEGA